MFQVMERPGGSTLPAVKYSRFFVPMYQDLVMPGDVGSTWITNSSFAFRPRYQLHLRSAASPTWVPLGGLSSVGACSSAAGAAVGVGVGVAGAGVAAGGGVTAGVGVGGGVGGAAGSQSNRSVFSRICRPKGPLTQVR